MIYAHGTQVQGRRPSLGVPRRSAGVVATATVRPSPSALRRSAAGASPLALRPAAQLPRPRSRRGSGAAAPAVARAAGGSGAASPGVSPEGLKAVLQAILRDPWDTPARPWRTFWATKLAATVVSADDAAGQVEVLPVETSGLRPPADREDAVHRLKTNAVLYRQNYALVFLGALAFGAFRYRTGLWHLAALASLVSYALASSDRALGEAQLASGGRLVWNAKRVAGVDRALLIRAAPVVGFLAIAACPLVSERAPAAVSSTPRPQRHPPPLAHPRPLCPPPPFRRRRSGWLRARSSPRCWRWRTRSCVPWTSSPPSRRSGGTWRPSRAGPRTGARHGPAAVTAAGGLTERDSRPPRHRPPHTTLSPQGGCGVGDQVRGRRAVEVVEQRQARAARAAPARHRRDERGGGGCPGVEAVTRGRWGWRRREGRRLQRCAAEAAPAWRAEVGGVVVTMKN